MIWNALPFVFCHFVILLVLVYDLFVYDAVGKRAALLNMD